MKTRTRVAGMIAVALALVGPAAPAASAGEPGWKVGLAQVKVTPSQPLLLSGYASRTKPFAGVTADLYVKAMVLEDSTGRRGVLVRAPERRRRRSSRVRTPPPCER